MIPVKRVYEDGVFEDEEGVPPCATGLLERVAAWLKSAHHEALLRGAMIS